MPNRPEEQLHKAILQAGGYILPFPKYIIFHVPNQRGTMAMRKILNGLGVVSGIPDLVIMRPRGRISWLEVKAAKGTLSDTQKELHRHMATIGHTVHVMNTLEGAVDLFRRWRAEDEEDEKNPFCG